MSDEAKALLICEMCHGAYALEMFDANTGLCVRCVAKTAGDEWGKTVDYLISLAPEPEPLMPESPDCPECTGSGMVDSGEFSPWGVPIECQCARCAGTGCFVAIDDEPVASAPSNLSSEAMEQAGQALERRRSDMLLHYPQDILSERLAPILAALKEFDALAQQEGA